MANRYWVGGTGTWDTSTTTHWALSSGATGGNSVPGTSDNVYFDSASGGGTVTRTATTAVVDLDFTGNGVGDFTGTFAGSAAISLTGSLKLSASMTRTYTGTINFTATTTGKTITSNGKILANIVTFNGVGGAWTLQDTYNNPTAHILTAGTVDFNGNTVTTGAFTTTANTSTKVLTFGSATVTTPTFVDASTGNCTINLNSATWNLSGTGSVWIILSTTTVNASTSTLNFTNTTSTSSTFTGGAKTYNTVTYKSRAFTIAGINTFTTLTLDTSSWTGAGTTTLSANQTITGVFTGGGSSLVNYHYILSSVGGTQRTIALSTTGSWSGTNTRFTDIVFTGTNTPISGNAFFNGLNNSGITFTTTRYWVGGAANLSTLASSGGLWSTTDGGTADQFEPDSTCNTFFTGGSGIITNDIGSLTPSFKDMDFTGFTGTFNCNTNAIAVYGSITLVSGMSITNVANTYFTGVGTHTITTAGKTLGSLSFQGTGGTYTLQDNLTCSSFTLTNGSFNTGDKDIINTGIFSISGAVTRTITLGSSTITCGTWTATTTTGLTFNKGTSKIIVNASSTFEGGGLTYYDVDLTGQTIPINGANTFRNLTRSYTSSGATSVISANQTVTGVFIGGGNSLANYISYSSSVAGTARTIALSTTGSWSGNNVSWTDITFTGTATPISGNGFRRGSTTATSGITYPTTLYWVGGSTTLPGAAIYTTIPWSLTSGGSGTEFGPNQTVGLEQNAVFDSGSSASSYIMTFTSSFRVNSLTISDPATGTCTFRGSIDNIYMYVKGNVDIGQNVIWTYLTSIIFVMGLYHTATSGSYTVSVPESQSFGNGGLPLEGWISTAGSTITFNSGFKSNYMFVPTSANTNIIGKTITVLSSGISGTVSGTLNITNSTINCTGTFTGTNFTAITSTGSTINLTSGNFAGGGKTYNNVNLKASAQTMTGANTITNLGLDYAAGTQTITLTSAVTQNINNIVNVNSATRNCILTVASASAPAIINKASGSAILKNITLQNIMFTGSGKFYLDKDSSINSVVKTPQNVSTIAGVAMNDVSQITGVPVYP